LGAYWPLEGRDICGAKIAARMQGRIVRRPMLQQEAMIERTRRVCREDERLAAAMMYGSFAQGEGDGFSDIERVVGESMRDADWLPSLEDTLILDRTGELGPRLPEIVGPPPERDTPGQIRFVCDCFVFGSNLFARGELARSLDLLGIVCDRLLQMVRVLEKSTLHWFNSAKFLETEISQTSYTRYAACTALTGTSFARLASLPGSGGGR
jgi:lincosamide nucleotidyltransferase